MPYIKREDRTLTTLLDPRTPGELNYAVSAIALKFLGETPNYQRFNDAVGALEAAKLELYRRRVAPYEDNKLAQNGDIF